MVEICLIDDQRRVPDLRQLEQELVILIKEFYGVMFFSRFGQGYVYVAISAGEDIGRDLVYFFWDKGFDEQVIAIEKDERVFGMAED